MSELEEPFICELDPATNRSLKVYLFKDVMNVEYIRQNVIKGVWKCSIIKPSLIIDIFQVVVAANFAILSETRQTLVTKTIYSEILYNLSLSKNISQSLSTFGIEKGNTILVCFIINNDDDVSEDIVKKIDGEQCPLSSLSSFTNMDEVLAVYNLKNLKKDVDLLDIITSKIVSKRVCK